MDSLPVDYFVTSNQYTRTTHNHVYPAIDPSSSALSMAGKVVIVTGASKGMGAQVSGTPLFLLSHSLRSAFSFNS